MQDLVHPNSLPRCRSLHEPMFDIEIIHFAVFVNDRLDEIVLFFVHTWKHSTAHKNSWSSHKVNYWCGIINC